MAKNLDSVKKLNPEEIKKNREIVLKYIGEKDSKRIESKKAVVRVSNVSKHIDGIRTRENKIAGLKEVKAGKIKESASFKKKQAEDEDKKAKFEKKAAAEKMALEKSAEEERKKKVEIEREKAELAQKEKQKAEEARQWREKLQEEQKQKEEERAAKEKNRLEKAMLAEEAQRNKLEAKQAKIKDAQKKKARRRKAAALLAEKFKTGLSAFSKFFMRAAFWFALYLAAAAAVFYFAFCVIVLRTGISGSVVMKIESVLPVPAAITNAGIISHNDFRGIKSGIAGYDLLSRAEKKNVLAKWIVLKKLSEKYGLDAGGQVEDLAKAFAFDQNFNQVGLSRIRKISEFLKNSGDMKQFGKYADEYGDTAYYSAEAAAEKFGHDAFNLKPGQISGIIGGGGGYYIAQLTDIKGEELGIKYLFVKAKTLSEHINAQAAKIKLFILAN